MDSSGSQVKKKILAKLEEYGDNLLQSIESSPKVSKKKRRQKKNSLDDSTTQTLEDSSISEKQQSRKKRKKRKKKRKIEDEDQTISAPTEDQPQVRGKQRQLLLLRQSLGLDEFIRNEKQEKTEKEKSDEKVTEKRSLPGGKRKCEPEVIIFNDPAKRNRKMQDSLEENDGEQESDRLKPQVPDTEFDMKQARLEVRKFGIRGLDNMEKEAATTALLIRLGARPPKKKYINYKELQKQRMEEKKREAEKLQELDQETGGQVGKKKSKLKRGHKDKNDVGRVDGQIGKYRDGVQFISDKDISSVNKHKKRH